jgi:anaerobic selenocysteine-containing dehydrogenase
LVIAADLFAGGGTVYHDDQLGELRPQATVGLSERTAAVAGVRDGDIVDVVAGERTLSGLVVRIAPNYVDGTVTILEGLPDAPASAFEGGQTVALTNIRAARAALGVA